MAGDDPSVESASTTSAKQQEGTDAAIDFAMKALEGQDPNAPFPGQLTAATPPQFQDTFDKFFSGDFEDVSQTAISDLISGKPAYEFDAGATADRFRTGFAEPMAEAFRELAIPILKESINATPGALFSRGTTDYLGEQTRQFFGSQIAPKLFSAQQQGEAMGAQSKENAAARRGGALSLPFAQFAQGAGVSDALQGKEQERLSRIYGEFIRQDPFRFAQLLGGVGTTPTIENIAFQGQQSPLLGIGAAAAGGFLGGPAFGAGGMFGG